MKPYNDYAKERDKVLNQFDPHIFLDWMHENHPKIESQMIMSNFASPKKLRAVIWGTMCKMCLASEGTTKATKQKAKKKLDQLGMSYDIK